MQGKGNGVMPIRHNITGIRRANEITDYMCLKSMEMSYPCRHGAGIRMIALITRPDDLFISRCTLVHACSGQRCQRQAQEDKDSAAATGGSPEIAKQG